MSYRHDEGFDELRIFQDYRGIFGGDAEGDPAPLSGAELGQLRSVLAGQSTFFFDNWLIEYDRADIKKTRALLDDPERWEEAGIGDAEVGPAKRLLDLVLANIHVANGPFYVGKDGKLGGVQLVSIAKCSEIVAAVNDCKPIILRSLREIVDGGETAEEDLAAIADFEKAGGAILKLEGNALTLRCPSSEAGYKKRFGEGFDDQAHLRVLRDAGIGIAWADRVVTFTLGGKDDEIIDLTLPVSEAPYTPNALVWAQDGDLVKPHFDLAEARRTFLMRKGAGD